MRFSKRFQLLELVLTTFSAGAAKAQGSKVKPQAQGGGASAVDKPQENRRTERDGESRVDSKADGE